MTDSPKVTLDGWFTRQAEKEAKGDTLKTADRFGNLIGIVGIAICIAFFAAHLSMPSGFFTSSFDAASAALFFGVNIWGIIASAARFITGKKSAGKIFDLLGLVSILVAVVYFLATFPFDFTHIADPLPDFLKFAVQWITDGAAKFLMTLGAIVMVILTPYQIVSYRYLREALDNPQPVPAHIMENTPDDKAQKP